MSEMAVRDGVEATHAKSHVARLLDMLIGWAEFTAEAGRAPDPAVPVEELYDLYQEAGAALMGLPEAEQPAAVDRFVRERVLPVLLRSSVDRGTAAH